MKHIRFLEMFLFLARQQDYIPTSVLASKFGIHRRTIFRYISDLKKVKGIEVKTSRKGIKIVKVKHKVKHKEA